MQGVFDFILSHLEAIISVLTLIVSVIVFILRKKPVNGLANDIYAYSVMAIFKAESTDLKGDSKLNYAIDLVIQSLNVKYPDLDSNRYRLMIKTYIETILSTPQKKED